MGAAATAVGVGAAVGGVVTAIHGGAVGINTLNKIFRHGNSASSNKPQHGYEIVDGKGDVKKVGVSGQPLNQNGTSPRANSQINSANKGRPFGDWLSAEIKKQNVPSRKEMERKQAEMRRQQDNSMDMHKRP